jgi:REP element-mobilizing transposase RayT
VQLLCQEGLWRDAYEGQTGWQVQALCLMPNHFHLVVETPQANLVAGMKWFLGGQSRSRRLQFSRAA